MVPPKYTPDEMRAQVQYVRQFAHDRNGAEFSLHTCIACGMLIAAAQQIEALEKELDDMTATLKAANDLLERRSNV